MENDETNSFTKTRGIILKARQAKTCTKNALTCSKSVLTSNDHNFAAFCLLERQLQQQQCLFIIFSMDKHKINIFSNTRGMTLKKSRHAKTCCKNAPTCSKRAQNSNGHHFVAFGVLELFFRLEQCRFVTLNMEKDDSNNFSKTRGIFL